jgi:hypothetical protein
MGTSEGAAAFADFNLTMSWVTSGPSAFEAEGKPPGIFSLPKLSLGGLSPGGGFSAAKAAAVKRWGTSQYN